MTSERRLEAVIERFPLKATFAISRSSVDEVEVVRAVVAQDFVFGQGECRPYARYGETAREVQAAILNLRPNVERGLDRFELRRLLPPGAARNALDCALIDLEAKLAGRPVAALLDLPSPEPCLSAFTLSVGTPEAMAEAAKATPWPLYKLKLAGEGDLERVASVRAAAPEARLIVDANEAWDERMAREWPAELAKLGVELIEQPLHSQSDGLIEELRPEVPFCADESFHDASSLEKLPAGYAYVNVKLDKTGGLTGALEAVEAARAKGLKVMVGCMMGTSLAMAPAMHLASTADLVDLDAPMWLKSDRYPAMTLENGLIQPPPSELWG